MSVKRNVNWSALSLVACAALCVSAPIVAYEVETHAAITLNAYQLSNLGNFPHARR
jgi:NADH:ubiquinone oxidoreductase subunit E